MMKVLAENWLPENFENNMVPCTHIKSDRSRSTSRLGYQATLPATPGGWAIESMGQRQFVVGAGDHAHGATPIGNTLISGFCMIHLLLDAAVISTQPGPNALH